MDTPVKQDLPIKHGAHVSSGEARGEQALRDRYFAAQLVLVLSLILWRGLEASPRVSTLDGGQFAASTGGRVLAFVCLALSTIALVQVAWTTWKRWRDLEIAALALLLVLSLAWRRDIDVFDLLYAASASAAALTWFFFRRARS